MKMNILIEYDDAISTLKNENKRVDSFHNAIGPGNLSRLIFFYRNYTNETRFSHFNWTTIRNHASWRSSR